MPVSVKSLSKQLESFFSSKEQPELPQNVLDAVVEYAEQFPYSDPSSESQRLQEELASVHEQHVTEAKYDILFLEVLSHLVPCLSTIDQLTHWFDHYRKPALDSAGYRNALVKSSRDFLISVMVHDYDVDDAQMVKAYSDISRQYCLWILDIYLDNSTWFAVESANYDSKEEERERFIKMNCKDLLTQFGKSRGKPFMATLNERMVSSKHRVLTLVLLSVYTSQQPRQLFEIENTELLNNLFLCLKHDLSATALSICSNVLAMTLPHICHKIVPRLPEVLALYGRLACWRLITQEEDDQDHGIERDDDTVPLTEDDMAPRQPRENKDEWDTLGHFFQIKDERKPSITPFFTFLYGLFPSNLLSFLRKPSKYLEKRGFTRTFDDFWNDNEILVMSKPLFDLHKLHTDLVSNTAEEELHDDNRFHRIGSPTDIASYCLELYNQTQGPDGPEYPKYKLPDEQVPNWFNDQVPMNSFIYNHEGDEQLGLMEKQASRAYVEQPEKLNMDSLLDEHAKLYTKSDRADSGVTSPASETSLASSNNNINTHTTMISPEDMARLRTRSNTLSSPGFTNPSNKSPNMTPISTPHVSSPRVEKTNALGQTTIHEAEAGEERDRDGDRDEELGALRNRVAEQQERISFLNRELMIQKNELDFVSFIEQHSQYKVKKMRNELTQKTINDESVRQTIFQKSVLQRQAAALRKELDFAHRNSKTYKRERQQYEHTIMEKTRESRDKANQAIDDRNKLQRDYESLEQEKLRIEDTLMSQEGKIAQMELQLDEAQEKSRYVGSYKISLKETEDKLERSEALNASGIGKDAISSARANELRNEIDELKLERDAIQIEMDQQVKLHKRDIDDARTKINELEAAKRSGPERMRELIDDLKRRHERKASELRVAYKDLNERHQLLESRFRNVITQEEDASVRSHLESLLDTSSKKSILGYDLDETEEPSSSSSRSNFHSDSPTLAAQQSRAPRKVSQGKPGAYRGIRM